VVVDGADEFMNAESFRAALLAEKKHFEEMEAERLRKKEQQRALGLPENNDDDDDTVSVVSEMDNEIEDLDKDGSPLTMSKDAPSDQDLTSLSLNNTHSATSTATSQSKKDDAATSQDQTTRSAATSQKKDSTNESQATLSKRSSEASDNTEAGEEKEKKKKKKPEMTEEMVKKEVLSKLVWESVELVKNPEETLCWILVEPRLATK